jgi:hypothetical protein
MVASGCRVEVFGAGVVRVEAFCPETYNAIFYTYISTREVAACCALEVLLPHVCRSAALRSEGADLEKAELPRLSFPPSPRASKSFAHTSSRRVLYNLALPGVISYHAIIRIALLT